MTYDQKCHDLARAFLADYAMSREARAEETERLAEAIQRTIEDHIEGMVPERRGGA